MKAKPKKVKLTREDRRKALSALRAKIIPEIVRLEKRYGISVVAGAFARHQEIRRERAKLRHAQAEINARIAKLVD